MSARSSLRSEQLAYYRAVANEYEDHAIDVPGQDDLLSAIDSQGMRDRLEELKRLGVEAIND